MAAYQHIAVVGLGLIGGSFAAACSERLGGVSMTGVDTLPSARDAALSHGWVSEALAPDDPSLGNVLGSADLVMVATPASVAGGYLELLESIGFDGVVTDTASTKGPICAHAERVLSRPGRFVPGHPMAGSEVNGIEGARADLFEGAHWILCPDAGTDPDGYAALHELLSKLQARVVSIPREDHDRAVAIVSHVPHIVAASLVELAARHADDQQALFRLAAGGFKDSTRIAAGSPELWCGISFDNREALGQGLEEIRQIIGQFAQALEHGDRERLTGLLAQSSQVRRSLPAKWVPSTDNLLEVRIPMENRQGVVAEVTTAASQVGCNIQSIEIDHVTADSAVLSMILTDEGDVGRLSTLLVAQGFAVSLSPLSAKEYTHVE